MTIGQMNELEALRFIANAIQNGVGEAAAAVPGGSSGAIQFNDGGAFGGDSGLTYDKTNNYMIVDGVLEADSFTGDGTDITGLVLNNITGLGTGIATALAINTGTTGAPALLGGAAAFTTLSAALIGTDGFTISGGTGTGSTLFNFPASKELLLSTDAVGFNVLRLKNTNTGNAFSGLALEGADNIEHGAFGVGNAGAGTFANSTYLETSYFPTSGTNAPHPLLFVQTGYINGSNQTRVMAKFLATGDFQFRNYAANESVVFDAATGYVGLNVTGSTHVAPVQPLDIKGTAVIGGTTGTAGRSLANGGGFALYVITPQTTAVGGTTAGNAIRITRDNVGKTDVTYTGTGATRALNFVDTDNSSVIPLSLNMAGTGVVTAGGLSMGGHITFTDNTYDIGASGATRPRHYYGAGNVTTVQSFIGGALDVTGNAGIGAAGVYYWASGSAIRSSSDGVIRISNGAANDFSRLQLGLTTSSGPAIARSTEYVNIVDGAGGNTSGLMINSGTPILGVLSNSATLDFGSILAAASADLTITVTGAAVGDTVSLGTPAAPDASITYTAFVSAADTVTVRSHNVGGIAVDQASGSFRVCVMKF